MRHVGPPLADQAASAVDIGELALDRVRRKVFDESGDQVRVLAWAVTSRRV
jgi:hypothetical protein